MDEHWRDAFLHCVLCSSMLWLAKQTCVLVEFWLDLPLYCKMFECVTNGRTMDENERDTFQLLLHHRRHDINDHRETDSHFYSIPR